MGVAVHVIYTDGRTETVRLTMRAMVEAERRFGGNMPRIEGSLFAAWKKLSPGGEFDDWLDTVEAVDAVDDSVDPPQPAPENG